MMRNSQLKLDGQLGLLAHTADGHTKDHQTKPLAAATVLVLFVLICKLNDRALQCRALDLAIHASLGHASGKPKPTSTTFAFTKQTRPTQPISNQQLPATCGCIECPGQRKVNFQIKHQTKHASAPNTQ